MLFAYTDLYVKGGTAAVPGRGLFTGGNLGSNGVATVGDPNATLGTNYGVYLPDGNAAVADRITLDRVTHSCRRASGTSSRTRSPTTTSRRHRCGTSARSASPPIIAPLLPSFVAFTHPGGRTGRRCPSFPSEAALNALPDIHLPGGFVLNLAPGSYGDIDLNDDSILNLTNGIYNLHSLQAGRNVTINTAPGTDVRIAVDFRSNNDLTIQGSDLARFYIRSDGLGPATFLVHARLQLAPDCPDDDRHSRAVLHPERAHQPRRLHEHLRPRLGRRGSATTPTSTSHMRRRRRSAARSTWMRTATVRSSRARPGSGLTFYVDYDNDSMLDADEPSGVSDANGDYVDRRRGGGDVDRSASSVIRVSSARSPRVLVLA